MNTRFKTQQGFSILETVVALGVAMVVAGGAVALFTSQNKQMVAQQMQAARNTIKQDLDATIKSYAALRVTANSTDQPDSTLFNCFDPDDLAKAAKGPFDCNISPGTKYPVVLHHPNIHYAVAGTEANPVYYRMDGTPCGATANKACPIKATSYFMATCADPTQCGRAQTVTLHYDLKVENTGGKTVFQDVSGEHVFAMDQEAGAGDWGCEEGTVASSWGAKGPNHCRNLNQIHVPYWDGTRHSPQPVSLAFTDQKYDPNVNKIPNSHYTWDECIEYGGTPDKVNGMCRFSAPSHPDGSFRDGSGKLSGFLSTGRNGDFNRTTSMPGYLCPVGWTQVENWTTTISERCEGGFWGDKFPSRGLHFYGVACDVGPRTDSGSHAWSNVDRATETRNVQKRSSWIKWRWRGPKFYDCAKNGSASCWSTVVEVGCR